MLRLEIFLLSALAVCSLLAVCQAKPPGPKWICGPTCLIACPCGRVLDRKGCATCDCLPCKPGKWCPQRFCHRFMKCGHGFVVENGCPICKCKDEPCPPKPQCDNFCPFGYEKVNGCHSCQCKPDIVLPPNPCGPSSICPAYLKCPFGYKKDKNGCQTCQCKLGIEPITLPPLLPKPCNIKLICPAVYCPYGYETDKNGCKTCTCRDGLYLE